MGTPACPNRSTMLRIHTPGHRTDEAFRRRRRKRRADLQQLRHESRIVRNPVAHHDAAAGLCHPDHLLGYVERLGCEHGAKHGKRQIKRMVGDAFQVARISLLKFQIGETRLRRSPVPGLNQIAGDVDSNDFSPRRASGTAVVPSPQPRSSTRSGGAIPRDFTTASPDSRMSAAISVKSPFSHNALFGFIATHLFSWNEVAQLYHSRCRIAAASNRVTHLPPIRPADTLPSKPKTPAQSTAGDTHHHGNHQHPPSPPSNPSSPPPSPAPSSPSAPSSSAPSSASSSEPSPST